MSIVRRNSLLFPALVNDVFKPDWFGGLEKFQHALPAVNILETERDYQLEVAIPGQKKEDFNIEVDDHVLTISMESKQENEAQEGTYTRKEFSYQSFKRSFTLPETVNEENIQAAYNDGILKFTLPKKEEALPKPKRLIEIEG